MHSPPHVISPAATLPTVGHTSSSHRPELKEDSLYVALGGRMQVPDQTAGVTRERWHTEPKPTAPSLTVGEATANYTCF